MSEATSSVRSSMVNELNYLAAVLSEEEVESDSSEDSNLWADMERELNLSSRRILYRHRGGRDQKVLNRK